MKESPVIPKLNKQDENPGNYYWLRSEGLKHIQELSGRLWTDYNTHDPGVTILEVLCFALTDLDYRTNFPIADLLAEEKDNEQAMHQQFLSAIRALPSRPVSIADYRKLLIDIPGVKNAWLKKGEGEVPLYFDRTKEELTTLTGGSTTLEPIEINGLYQVIIEYDEDLKNTGKKQVMSEVYRRLNANRNLCESFTGIATIDPQDFIICGEIGLSANADIEKVEARILYEVQNYLSPSVRSYTLQQLLDKGKKAEEIFEGPLYQDADQLFSGGFIDDDELEASRLKTTIYLSDLIHLIMDLDGVESVRDLIIKPNVANLPENWDKWVVAIKEDKQARLDTDLSRFVFYKDLLAFRSNQEQVDAELAQLNAAEKTAQDAVTVSDLPMIKGTFVDPASYVSVANEFPVNYGIGEIGLPGNASNERKAQARQLKSYLLFFDQLMANYFAQLSRVKELFSTDNSITQTYFSQLVEGLEDRENLFADWDHALEQLNQLSEDETLFYTRRHQFMDHLLARFNEQFNDYVLLMYSLSGELAERDDMLEDKANFLKNYDWTSRHRAGGFNITLEDELWDTLNVSGLQHRVAKLLGIRNYKRRDLARIHYDIYDEKDEDDLTEYRFRVVDSETDKILISSSTRYLDKDNCISEMKACVNYGVDLENYELKETSDGRYYFNITDPTKEVIGRRIEYFETSEERAEAIKYLRRFLRANYNSEGLFVVEHVLLRPHVKGHPVFRICPSDDSDCVFNDPYSYQISVILPAWEKRFQNMDFRRFVEKTIRQETPAHVFPKICWVDEIQLSEFEGCYQEWLFARSIFPKKATNYKNALGNLLDILVRLHSIYPQGTLHDCVDGGDENPMILNLTSLGSMKNKDQKK